MSATFNSAPHTSPIDLVPLPEFVLADIVKRTLDEDVGHGDLTTMAIVPPGITTTGVISSSSPGVVSGMDVARAVFETLDPNTNCTALLRDGANVQAGDYLVEFAGDAAALLTGERTALNFMQRMSGIATTTAAYVSAVAHTGARIVDTRKTVPGLRILDKYSVRCGGGLSHRFGLFDGILIKDNHIIAAGGVEEAVRRAREHAPHLMKVEVEVDGLDDIEPAVSAGADIVLLDNMETTMLAVAVGRIRGRCLIEASGGITLRSVAAIAETGVDFISVGALTHSVSALDLGMEIVVNREGYALAPPVLE